MKKALKKLALTPKIYRRHGSLKPQSVRLPPHNHEVFINPEDQRAYKKLVMDTARGRESQPMQFWRVHATAFPDAVLLDVGANYGECAFNPAYADTQLCIAVEANPTLRPYLDKTHAAHPSKDRIRIVSALVGDAEIEAVPFTYNPGWTGGGSACIANPDADDMVTVNLEQKRLDLILSEAGVGTDRPLVFKMDIEGYECKAFRGFKTLPSFPQAVGIIEFDTAMIKRSGEDPAEFFTALRKTFHVYHVPKRGTTLREVATFADFSKISPSVDFHCDFVLATSPDVLAGSWTTE